MILKFNVIKLKKETTQNNSISMTPFWWIYDGGFWLQNIW